MIGNAAHTLSPIGGVCINLAVQDAVAAANALTGPMAAGEDPDALTPLVEQRRLWPTTVTHPPACWGSAVRSPAAMSGG